MNMNVITLEDAMINYDAKNIATICCDGGAVEFEYDGYHKPVYRGVNMVGVSE